MLSIHKTRSPRGRAVNASPLRLTIRETWTDRHGRRHIICLDGAGGEHHAIADPETLETLYKATS